MTGDRPWNHKNAEGNNIQNFLPALLDSLKGQRNFV